MTNPAEPTTALRRELHRHPERSGDETATAERVLVELAAHAPDRIATHLGGRGVVAEYLGARPGPTVLARCELDGLPIRESPGRAWGSRNPGTSHACGHDGHIALLLGLAARLSRERPARGRVLLLFQPAEETGAGAARVLADPAFVPFRPDRAFALHNLPGFPLGAVVLRDGPFACASVGLHAELHGSSAHAAEPHLGRSPGPALAALIADLPRLPARIVAANARALATVIHARLGSPAFGTAPGEAELMVTLRAPTDALLRRLADAAAERIRAAADLEGLATALQEVEPFPATINDPAAAACAAAAAEALGLPIVRPEAPFPWSEDFGHFTAAAPGALIGLGAGEDHPALHRPDYDFPDPLLPIGIDLWERLVRRAATED